MARERSPRCACEIAVARANSPGPALRSLLCHEPDRSFGATAKRALRSHHRTEHRLAAAQARDRSASGSQSATRSRVRALRRHRAARTISEMRKLLQTRASMRSRAGVGGGLRPDQLDDHVGGRRLERAGFGWCTPEPGKRKMHPSHEYISLTIT